MSYSIELPIPREMLPSLKLNLGCGSVDMPGYIGVDRAPGPAVHVVHDLDVLPWPFLTDAVERIEAKDIFEHVNDPIGFMTECHRVLEPEGVLHIRTPHFTCLDAFTDPTHKRFPTEHTFDYWIPGTVLYQHHNLAYGGVAFKRTHLMVDATRTLDVVLLKITG